MRTSFIAWAALALITVTGCPKKDDAPAGASSSAASASAAASVAPSPASSGPHGTPAEAKAMLDKAAKHYDDVGRKQALADFNTKKPPFGDRDLYVACIGVKERTIAANGGFPNLVGTSIDAWKDADGKPLGKAMMDAAPSKGGEGSVKYRWVDPVDRKMESKLSFVKNLGDDVCVVGVYSP